MPLCHENADSLMATQEHTVPNSVTSKAAYREILGQCQAFYNLQKI